MPFGRKNGAEGFAFFFFFDEKRGGTSAPLSFVCVSMPNWWLRYGFN